jgi:hypothetical protein
MRKLYIIFCFAFISTLISCNKKFDKAGWNYSEGEDVGDLKEYPNRDKMVKDLLENHPIKGLTALKVFDLLGETEIKEDKAIYVILNDFGSDIDPVRTKYLEIKFNIAGIAESAKIVEWQK